MKRVLLSIFIVLVAFLGSNAQKSLGVGVSGMYNFQMNSYGVGIRGLLPINDVVSVTPQFAYYLPGNPIHEIYLGANLQYSFVFWRSWEGYFVLGGHYNNWINYDEYSSPKKKNNLALEVGGGIMTGYGCLRPFAEARYDMKWRESNARVGIYLFFGACKGGGGGSPNSCPAFN